MVKRAATGILLGLVALVARAEVQVDLDRNPVQVNESFQLVFSLDHEPDLAPDFSLLQQHFQILNSNRSNSISIINGQYQRSVKYTLQLMARQAGDFMIPAIRFGQQRSAPVQLTVKPSSVADLPQNDLLFEVIPRQTEIYVQSQVIVKLRLLSAKNISAYQFGDIVLENVDAVIEPLGDVQDYQTRVADRTYLVLEQRFALFPQQSGRLGIPSILAEVRLPSGSSFDPFRSSGEIRRIRSQPVHIEIKPIPAAADGEFWLPARQVMLREELPDDLDDLVAGEPITRSLSIVADGLTAAQLPEIEVPAIDGIKQYPDQPGLNNRRSGNGITGMRTQKIALIPSSAGVYQLPEISLRWWNLQTGQLETASIPARELRVGGAAPATTATESGSGTADLAGTATARDSGDGVWLWVSLLLALGWGVNVIYWRYRMRDAQTARHPDTHVTSMRQARKSLQLACAANDASRARDALLNWGRALLAPRPVVNLHQLERLFGSNFADELTRLNRSLFSAGPDDWHGADLWRVCQALESRYQNRASPDTSELSPLNP